MSDPIKVEYDQGLILRIEMPMEATQMTLHFRENPGRAELVRQVRDGMRKIADENPGVETQVSDWGLIVHGPRQALKNSFEGWRQDGYLIGSYTQIELLRMEAALAGQSSTAQSTFVVSSEGVLVL